MIDIWYSDISNIDEKCFEKLLNSFPETIQKDVLRYRFFKDRKLKLLGRLLISQFEQQRVGFFSWENWRLDSRGKPFIKSGINFNISHSEDIVAVAFSEEEIGLDIEKKIPVEINDFKGYFHSKEKECLLNEVESKKLNTFYFIWTRKEAFLKAIGTGIVNGLNNENCLDSSILYKNNRYNIYTTSFLNEYTLSICEKNSAILSMGNVDFKEVLIHELYTL